jgi:hypothetical protein
MPAVDPTSPLENLRWACESTAAIVGNVRRDELAQPTPCRDWTVADLIFVHGWDLARATGQSLPEDPGVAAWLWGSSWPALSDEVRNEHPSIFAPEIPIAAERPTLDRLLGFLGRDPDWVGPA